VAGMTEYKILQAVKNVVKTKQEVIYTGKTERLARYEFNRFCKEYPTEYFELIKVSHDELCLDYVGQA
jgi:hypothetical protein